jgi:hypothetical protein
MFFHQFGKIFLNKGHKDRIPTEILGFQKDHSTPTNRSGGCMLQILHLKHHGHPPGQLNNLPGRETQLLIII